MVQGRRRHVLWHNHSAWRRAGRQHCPQLPAQLLGDAGAPAAPAAHHHVVQGGLREALSTRQAHLACAAAPESPLSDGAVVGLDCFVGRKLSLRQAVQLPGLHVLATHRTYVSCSLAGVHPAISRGAVCH